jgi:hypothetical protein
MRDNELEQHDPEGPEKYNETEVKNGETFYNCHTALYTCYCVQSLFFVVVFTASYTLQFVFTPVKYRYISTYTENKQVNISFIHYEIHLQNNYITAV